MSYQCDTCGTVGTEDDLCVHGDPCPDEQCEGTCWFLDSDHVEWFVEIRANELPEHVIESIEVALRTICQDNLDAYEVGDHVVFVHRAPVPKDGLDYWEDAL